MFDVSELSDIQLLDTKVTLIDVNNLHRHLEHIIEINGKKLFLNVNAHCLNLAHEQKWLREFLNQAYVVFCDGAGVILGANILGHHIPERITYADWIWQLAKFAEPRKYSFFFLGAREGVAERASVNLKKRYPNLEVVGVHHGYFKKTYGYPENEFVIDKINRLKPDILVVGFGMPLQERWLMENWEDIDAKVALTGGAVFNYTSGVLKRAPKWMTNHGLEWLGRLIIEPRRLWKRYLFGNPIFLWRILKQRLRLLLF